MKPGDLTIVLEPTYHRPYGQHGWASFPEEYGYHSSIYVLPDTIGIILEKEKNSAVFYSSTVRYGWRKTRWR